MKMSIADLKAFLDEKSDFYNHPGFIADDPISISHQFSKKEDIEIAGFLTATIAWGNRKSIIKNANQLMKLMQWMDFAPYDFITGFSESDLGPFRGFVHRTFNGSDCVSFLFALKNIYQNRGGLENLFVPGPQYTSMKESISRFRQVFFEVPHDRRTEKHLADPMRNASAKRLNMYLRWMVRQDDKGVDFGIWQSIDPALLMCPLDIHTGNVARKLGLLSRKQNDWKAVEELTSNLRKFDSADPVKYDFALFGLGIYEKF